MSHPIASRSRSMPPDSASAAQRTPRRTKHQAKAQKSSQGQSQKLLLTPHRHKVLAAGGAITLLAMATVLPTQVASEAIANSNCEQVIKSGAEISRGQLSSLLAMPASATRTAVRQAVNEPYCTLPAITSKERTGLSVDNTLTTDTAKTDTAKATPPTVIEREAYPLAFDPEAWVVLNYSAGEYQGYDFVFKP